ncbi:AmmeMemoRadiSam system radical SAM enzyme [Candidatus Altiarchaeota archaeon]
MLEQKITRREFLKKAAAGVAGITIGAIGYDILFPKKKQVKVVPPGRSSKKAFFQEGFGPRVRCLLCPNACMLGDGEQGLCRNRINKGGTLYSLAYGNPASVHVDPIEKKPLYHFLPGTGAFSIACGGCNFSCLNCQNWSISQKSPSELRNADMMPDLVVENAVKSGCASIAYTYSEPSTFYEYMHDTQVAANKHGVKGVWVSNGYINKEPFERLSRLIHAANIDLKAFDEGVYRKVTGGTLKPVLDTLKAVAKSSVWLEVTNLIVPTLTDDLEMIAEMYSWMYKNLGPDVPVHISRFHPAYKLDQLAPTPVATLEKAYDIAKDEGMGHVYIGNVPGTKRQDTICPSCGRQAIKRMGYSIKGFDVQGGLCTNCGAKIPGVFG